MSFADYLESLGVNLYQWQEEAAYAFLKVAYENRATATGKTFLARHLANFIEKHGNDFDLE